MLKLQRINELAIKPKRANPTDSGMDLTSVENVIIPPGKTVAIATGWKMAVPSGFEIQIRPRSGLALKRQITVLNSPGTIDCSYRGEVKVILHNEADTDFSVSVGDKIAQMVIAPVFLWVGEEVSELDETERGSGGFGSTGVR